MIIRIGSRMTGISAALCFWGLGIFGGAPIPEAAVHAAESSAHGLASGSCMETVDADVQRVVRGALVDGWQRGSAGREALAQWLELGESLEIDDPRFSMAAALAYLHHSQNQPALIWAQRLTEQHPEYIEGWYVLVWLYAATGQGDRALVAIQNWRGQLDELELDPLQRLEHFGRLGRFFGFVEGPGRTARVTNATLQRTFDVLIDEADDDSLAEFESERQAVLETWNLLLDERQDVQQQRMAEAIEQQQQEIANIERRMQEIRERQAELAPEAERIRQQAAAQVDALREQLASVESQGASLRTQINSLRADLSLVWNEILWLQSLLAQDPESPNRDWLLLRINSLAFAARSREVELAGLRNRYNALAREAARLQNEISRTRYAEHAEVSGLQREFDNLQRLHQRATARMNRLRQPPRVAGGALHALQARARSIMTYETLPLEMMRNDILATFRP